MSIRKTLPLLWMVSFVALASGWVLMGCGRTGVRSWADSGPDGNADSSNNSDARESQANTDLLDATDRPADVPDRADAGPDYASDIIPDLIPDLNPDAADAGPDRMPDFGPEIRFDTADGSRDFPKESGVDLLIDIRPDVIIPPDRPTEAGETAPWEVPETRTLQLFAGNTGGVGNIDGVGTLARFVGLKTLAFDGNGGIFVVDANGDFPSATIRRLDIATGAVSTFAGFPGPVGIGRLDGIGAAAQFLFPVGIASDGAGMLLVTDVSAGTIRKIDIATHAVSTLVGPVGSDYGANATGIVSDRAGHLFFADSAANTLRQVDVATGAVTTLAGTTGIRGSEDGVGLAASFTNPRGVALDGNGNLLVADSGNSTIRKIEIATARVTTLAGLARNNGTDDGTGNAALFFLPTGLASDDAGNLYVSDSFNHTIRKIVLATGVVSTIAGAAGSFGDDDGVGTEARFHQPFGLAIDGKGGLFVADTGNNVVRRIELATATVTTLAGAKDPYGHRDGTGDGARFNSPYGIANDGAGHLLVSDGINRVIRKIEIATGAVSTLAGSVGQGGTVDGIGAEAGFAYPYALAADQAGNLFVSDQTAFVIRQVVIATAEVTTLAGSPYIPGSNDGVGTVACFGQSPGGLTTDSFGNLFVSDTGNCTIRKIVIATKAVSTIAGLAGDCRDVDGRAANARFIALGALALDNAKDLWISDGCALRRLDLSTGEVTTVAGSQSDCGGADGVGAAAKLSYTFGLALDGKGNLFAAESRNSVVRQINLATAAVTTPLGRFGQIGVVLGPLPASLNYPFGLAMGPAGELFIADEGAVLVLR